MQLIRFDIFRDTPLVQAFSTRRGGVSNGPFSSLNLGRSTADDAHNVEHNRRLFFDELNVEAEQLVFPQQVHSAHAEIASTPGVVANCDALITATPGLYLTIQTADCFPVFLYEADKGVVALIHSGWRGTAASICSNTIAKMVEAFGCRPEKMLAAIGPGITQKNYQVDEKTAAQFSGDHLLPDGPGHYRLDVRGAIVRQLVDAGLPLSRIEIDERCTFENKELFYSYRRDGQESGRMMGVLGMKR